MSIIGKYLRGQEWGVGHGQCPQCLGVSESWLGHPLYRQADTLGHRAGCTLAAALTEAGETPLMKGKGA